MTYKVEIDESWRADALHWAREHCLSYIGNTNFGYTITIEFKDEKDALMFTLRWL